MSSAAERQKQAERLVPQYPDLQELAKLVPRGRELIPGLSGLAGEVDQASQEQQIMMMERASPGVMGRFQTASGQVDQMLQGVMPQDVINRLQSNVAARAMAGGVPGSGFSGNQFANTLGLTSLDLIGRGITSLMGITEGAQKAFTVPRYDIANEIPGLTDLYSRDVSQELARSQVGLEMFGLDQAKSAFNKSLGAVTNKSKGPFGAFSGQGFFNRFL